MLYKTVLQDGKLYALISFSDVREKPCVGTCLYENYILQNLPPWETFKRRRQQMRRRTTTESPINIEEEFTRPGVSTFLVYKISDFQSLKWANY